MVGVFLLTLPFLLWQCRRIAGRSTFFLFGVMWVRLLLAALHPFTYPPALAGLSINALFSIMVVGLGVLVLNLRTWRLKRLGSIYLMIAMCLLSAAFNGGPLSGMVVAITKYAFLATIVVAAFDVFSRHRSGDVFLAILTAYAAPMILLGLSVATGLGKGNEEKPETISFVGGFYHEATFSIVVFTVLAAACFLDMRRNRIALPVIVLSSIGLVFVNYRTALIAALPLIVSALYFRSIRKFAPRDRMIVSVLLITLGVGGLIVATVALQHRYEDISVAIGRSTDLIKLPEHFTADERQLFSARLYIWAMYLWAYAQGDFRNWLFGFGPEFSDNAMPVHAHNTFVGTLYDLGLFGLIGVILLLVVSTFSALRVRGPMRPLMVATNGSFLIFNLATMPLSIIEGDLLFGLLLAATWTASMKHAGATEFVLPIRLPRPTGKDEACRMPIGEQK
jgi:hypothetical protein